MVGHLTADHLAALLPSADLELKLEQVSNEVDHFIDDDGIQLKIGIYRPSEDGTLDNLRHGFDFAKMACDSIKSDSSRSIAVYRPSMGESVANKAYVLRHFTEALEKHYLKVYYQPVIRTLTEKLSGFEALVRWEDPAIGMIYPNVFIPVLEEAQLISRLDRYVLEQVARMTRDRMDNGLNLVPVSVNLSVYDFDGTGLLDSIEKTVRRYQIPKTVMCFEITERVMIRNHLAMSQKVREFQHAGYQVWMDDFGSEYSSLSSLHNYHFDVIKIDMGFFSHFDDRSRQIITSVVMMARMLGVQTLAEGVETQEQVSFLKKIGCGRIQGYYYGRPVMYEDTLSLMRTKGFQLETPEEAHMMDIAESINVVSDAPTSIFRFDGTNVVLLIENDAYTRELRTTGTQSMAEANANLGAEGYPFRGRFQQLLNDALRSKAWETLTYTDNGQYIRVSVRWLAGDERDWIGEAHLYNISNDSAIQQANTLDNTLRSIFQLYEGFYLLDRGEGEVKILKSSHSEVNQRKVPLDLQAFIDYFTANLVYPDDRARFREFISSEEAGTKSDAEGGPIRAGLVRIRRADRTYRWAVFEAIVMYKSEAKNVLLCERDDIWEKKGDRDTLLPIFCRSFGILETGAVRPETLDESSLFRALCNDSPYPFFWKDREGRILGVSRSLLKDGGFRDASPFLGKTEEELGGHFDLAGMGQSEDSQASDGEYATTGPELMLLSGRLQEARISRTPWYQEKEIAGTLSMIGSIGSEGGDEESRLGLVDRETGFLSFRGAIEAGLLYADQHRLRKVDYVGLLMDVPAFSEAMQESAENAKVILTELSASLHNALTPGWAVARIGLCCFLCFCQRDNAGNIEERMAKITEILPQLWKRLGIRTVPALAHAVAYGSEVRSLDELLQLLTRRLSSAENEEYGDKPYTDDHLLVRREVLDGLSEYVVISDPKTYELVYMNQAARKRFGFGQDEILKGHRCYRELEGFDAPCKDCPNMMLRMDRAFAMSHVNHKTGDDLIVRSFLTSWENRTLRVTIAFNLNGYLDTLAKDRGMFYQEMRANEAISRGILEADPEKGIEQTVACIADTIQPERFLIFEEHDDNTVSAICEWKAPDVLPLKDELQSIPRTGLAALYAEFASNRLVMVKDMEAFRKKHPNFSPRIPGVHSFISGQLLLQNQREGFTLVINPSVESFQTGRILYSTLTDFIAAMVRNRNSMRELERQSMIDQLTGAGNRRALERRIREWQGDGVLGAISIDLNGLKNTNDTQGHHAGDMLICETARVLEECSGEDCVFRTGGDEFVVVTENLEERDIRMLIRHMRKSAYNNGISMAIGYACNRGKLSDFDALLTKADFNMYQDKGHSFRRRREDR